MHNVVSHSTLHYRAALNIFPLQSLDETHVGLIKRVRKWADSKISVPEMVHKSWFFQGGDYKEKKDRIYNKIIHTTRNLYTEEPTVWAFKLIEQDKEFAWRWWTTEITLTMRADHIRFITFIHHQLADSFAGTIPPNPSISVPRFVKSILTRQFNYNVLSGGMAVVGRPLYASDENIPTINENICDPKRKLPIVMISFDEEQNLWPINPIVLSKCVAGTAAIVAIKDVSVLEQWNYLVGEQYACPKHGIRLYMGNVNHNHPHDYKRHRYFSAASLKNAEDVDNVNHIVDFVARRSSVLVHGDFPSFQSVVDFNERTELDNKIMQVLSDATSSSDNLRSLLKQELQNKKKVEAQISDLSDQLNQQEERIEDVSIQLLLKDDEITKHKREADALKQYKEMYYAQRKRLGDTECPSNFPITPLDITAVFKQYYPNRIAFHDRAIQDMESIKLTQVSDRQVFWNLLFNICNLLWPMLFDDEKRSSNPEHDYNSSSNYKLALTEGSQTRKTSEFMAEREFQFAGRNFKAEPHIKFQVSQQKDSRLYFAIDHAEALIIVYRAFPHLTTSGSRKRAR